MSRKRERFPTGSRQKESERLEESASSRQSLPRNVLSLYGVQAATLLVPLVTVPYLSRVLGPSGWGSVLFAQSLAVWLSLVIEHGFGLSATREVATGRDDPKAVAAVASGVLGAKAVLVVASALPALLAWFLVPQLARQPELLLSAWILAVAQGIHPLWYFQGMERMVFVSLVDVVARGLVAVAIFLWISSPAEGWKVLSFQAGGALASSAVAFCSMYLSLPFRWPSAPLLISTLKGSWRLFVFRGASSFYTAANLFVLGLIVRPSLVGIFGAAEKTTRAFLALLIPLAQALYPRINSLLLRNARQAQVFVRRSLLLFTIAGGMSAIAMVILAPQLIQILFGDGFDDAVPVLRVLALVAPLVAASNVLGIQWMLPRGMDQPFLRIILLATGIDIALGILLASIMGPLGMAFAVVTTEGIVVVGMYFVGWRERGTPKERTC